jgi:GntR family phosphonate transport system transcriptional regulator
MTDQHPRRQRQSKRQPAAAAASSFPTSTHRPAASATPIWQRVADSILNDIKSGRFVEGMRLPAETALAREHGVNRHTLRRALAELTARAKLRSVPHVGSFVERARIPFPLDKTTRFGVAMENAGHRLSGVLLSSEVRTPPEHIAAQLKVAARTEVIAMVHVRKANDRPFCLVTTWLPADRFTKIPIVYQATGSLQAAFALCGVSGNERIQIRISSRLAESFERQHLGLEDGAIVLLIETLNIDSNKEPIHVSRFVFSAESFEFVVQP